MVLVGEEHSLLRYVQKQTLQEHTTWKLYPFLGGQSGVLECTRESASPWFPVDAPPRRLRGVTKSLTDGKRSEALPDYSRLDAESSGVTGAIWNSSVAYAHCGRSRKADVPDRRTG